MVPNQGEASIIRCPACGAGNRIPLERIGAPANCGKCHKALPTGNGPPDYKMRCVACGAKNRIPAKKVNAAAKCGKCGAELTTAELFKPQPVMVTDANFDSQVLKSPLPVLLFAWAPWCSSCSAAAPIIDQFAREAQGKVRVSKVNIDANPNLASKFNIMSVPFIFIFDNGQMKESLPGALQKHELMFKMAQYL
jgi:thioredoxin 2